ncbi:MAG TPA: hypothetical protein VM223_21500, partial [Planctomycetota bacterium]|nr:hypothetical protein [Planctomycetota bacterium]
MHGERTVTHCGVIVLSGGLWKPLKNAVVGIGDNDDTVIAITETGSRQGEGLYAGDALACRQSGVERELANENIVPNLVIGGEVD